MASTSDAGARNDEIARQDPTLPPQVEEQISQIEDNIHTLGVELHKLRKICPLIDEVPRISAMVDTAEDHRTEIRAIVRMIRDRLRVPFTIVETDFGDERVEHMQPGMLEARAKGGRTFLRSEIQHGPAADVSELGPSSSYALSVEYRDDSDYAEWKTPYKLQFTPDPHWRDSEGRPFPAVSVNVDEKGSVRGGYKQAMLHKEMGSTSHLDEETLAGPVPAESVRWTLKPASQEDTSPPSPGAVVRSSDVELISLPPVSRWDDELEGEE
ncbi:hypothetical protein EDD16DRAFT_1538583 [Pisolithus croceorrhizus]|nr:hypothetical protein EDD16DRAFT_1538583 [Pisolithus croceorrhizus]